MDNNFQNTNTSFHVPFSKATDWHAKKKHMKVFRPWWQYANIIRDPVSSFLLFQCVIIFVPSNAMSNNSFLQKILSCCFYNEYETKNINMKIGIWFYEIFVAIFLYLNMKTWGILAIQICKLEFHNIRTFLKNVIFKNVRA